MRKVYLLGALVIAAGGFIVHAQQKPIPNMMGTVVMLEQKFKPGIAYARFEPGARTRWHSHEGGQILLCEEGACRTQVKGGPVIELKPGETTYAGPGVMHWHGASPDASAVQYNITRGGTTWGEDVSDQEFGATPKK